jgi:uncharacterized membrane protein YqjE
VEQTVRTDIRSDTTESPPRSSEPEGESALALLRRVADEASTLVRQEFALATTEIKVFVRGLLAAVGSIAVGGIVLFAGFLVLLAAVTLALALVLSPWLAALIVGAAVSLVGMGMLLGGLKKLKPSNLTTPRLTRESLRRDKELLTGDKS